MKRGLLFLLILLLCIPFTIAEGEDFSKFSSLELDFSLQSGIDLNPTGGKNNVEFFETQLSFFPKDDAMQTVLDLNIDATPSAKTSIEGNYAIYKWVKAKAGEPLQFSVDAVVTTKNDLSKIRNEMRFPVTVVDDDVLEYTKASKFIDINPAIEGQAYSIIGSEDDLYQAMFKLADWTKNNIEYDLNSLTAEAVQKSSWVLDHREGVCDEMTNLFISFSRSVGIPARFVSGMVYTNLDDSWGPHGWAEIYFPGHGWVPFDVTFGQYGWLDASHLKLKDSLDSGAPSAEYSWRASGVDVDLRGLEPSVQLINKGPVISSPLEISIDPVRSNVGFGSYVPILVTVENKENYYVSTSLVVKKAPELTEDNDREILLLPGETKTVGWIVKIESNLDEGYIYTGVLEVESAFGDIATSKITYAKEYPPYSLRAAEKVIYNLEQRSEKKEIVTLKLSCNPGEDLYYSNESAVITCAVKNVAAGLVDVDVCLRADCKTVSLAPDASQSLEFAVDLKSSGRIPVTAETSGGFVSSFVSINLVALPELYISEVKPYILNYKDDVELSFDINSDSEISNVHLEFLFGDLDLESFTGSRTMKIETDGKSLYMKGLKFSARFTDEKGAVHTQNIAIPIQINNVPWYAGFAKWVNNLF